MSVRTLRKRTREASVQCRCGSMSEVIMTRLRGVNPRLSVRKVLGIWCEDCKEVKV